MHSTAARRWAALVDQCEHSNLTNRQFTEQAGVNPSTLAWWKWRLGASRRATVRGPFVEIIEESVDVESGGEPIRIDLGGRLSIDVDHRTDLALLREVVGALC